MGEKHYRGDPNTAPVASPTFRVARPKTTKTGAGTGISSRRWRIANF